MELAASLNAQLQSSQMAEQVSALGLSVAEIGSQVSLQQEAIMNDRAYIGEVRMTLSLVFIAFSHVSTLLVSPHSKR